MSYYYTLIARDFIKQTWDVVKYTKTLESKKQVLITDVYTYTESETIKSSLSYNDASNLATILNKLND